jgi:mannose-6-phosphate isomerase-like protein (cupin superfamily)
VATLPKAASSSALNPKSSLRKLVDLMVDAEVKKVKPTHSDARRDLVSFPEAKVLTLKQDTMIGGHYHLKKEERFILSEGEGLMRIGTGFEQVQTVMQLGRIYTVGRGQYHEFHLTKGSVLVGLNSEPYDPADDYRLPAKEAA